MWDRILHFIVGVGLLSFAIAGGPLWTYSGLFGILIAAWAFSPVYAFFNIKTLRIPPKKFDANLEED
jgi:hypothetical protein